MNLDIRKNIILNMLQQNPNMGKTAIMKAMFMLQQVKGVELGCDFSIYTYGPYTSDIMEDIDELVSEGYLTSTMYHYNNYIGYNLSATDRGNDVTVDLDGADLTAVKDVSSFIHGKTARDLELYSTIIYISNLYSKNFWVSDEPSIVKKVHEIKPHFSEETIQSAYHYLKEIAYI